MFNIFLLNEIAEASSSVPTTFHTHSHSEIHSDFAPHGKMVMPMTRSLSSPLPNSSGQTKDSRHPNWWEWDREGTSEAKKNKTRSSRPRHGHGHGHFRLRISAAQGHGENQPFKGAEETRRRRQLAVSPCLLCYHQGLWLTQMEYSILRVKLSSSSPRGEIRRQCPLAHAQSPLRAEAPTASPAVSLGITWHHFLSSPRTALKPSKYTPFNFFFFF